MYRNKIKIKNTAEVDEYQTGKLLSNEEGFFYIYNGVVSEIDYPTYIAAKIALEAEIDKD